MESAFKIELRPMWILIKVNGRGVSIFKDDGGQPLFSERYGYTKVKRRLGLKIVFLTPRRP